jgi:hypothetical protein
MEKAIESLEIYTALLALDLAAAGAWYTKLLAMARSQCAFCRHHPPIPSPLGMQNQQVLTYKGWTVAIALSSPVAGEMTGAATLSQGEVERCRISLTQRAHSVDSATDTLMKMARGYVDAWLAREHDGDTDFSEL